MSLDPTVSSAGSSSAPSTESTSGRAGSQKPATICLIVNPRAGAGRAGKRLDELRRMVGSVFDNWDIRLTDCMGHATSLARQAVAEGFDVVAAVGGDGTCNEVAAGLLPVLPLAPGDEGAVGPGPVFTIVPFGTGSDLRKSLEIPRDTIQALRIARNGVDAVVDVALASFQDARGVPTQRYLLNVAGFGSNGEVVARANRGSKILGGKVTFFKATVEAIFAYKPQPLRLAWEGCAGAASWEGSVQAVFIANGQFCGGGMWVGRGGSLVDGLLEVVVIPVLPPWVLGRHMAKLYSGDMGRVPGVQTFQVRTFRVEPISTGTAPVLIDIDGEQPGKLPLEIMAVPRRLRVRGGWAIAPAAFPP